MREKLNLADVPSQKMILSGIVKNVSLITNGNKNNVDRTKKEEITALQWLII